MEQLLHRTEVTSSVIPKNNTHHGKETEARGAVLVPYVLYVGYHIFPSYIYTHSPNQPIFGYCRQQKLRDARTTRVQILTSFFFPSRLDSIQMKYGDTYPSWHQNYYPWLNFYHVRTLWSSLGGDAYCMRLKPSPSRCSDVFPLFFLTWPGSLALAQLVSSCCPSAILRLVSVLYGIMHGIVRL